LRYFPHTPEEIASMLAAVGKGSIDDLYSDIPEEARLGRALELDPPMHEASLMRHLEDLSRNNRGSDLICFLGAGAYDHHVPPAVDQLLLRSELYTAYTPYQAEVAQGTLQSVFEFQTIVSEIFGLPVANASMYDAASAAAEAVLFAQRLTKRERVLVSDGVHPHYRAAIETYLSGIGTGKRAITRIALGADGQPEMAAIERSLGDDVAAVVIGYPNFYGCVTDVARVAEIAHGRGARLVTVTGDPFALSVLEPPGALGADIAVGEGQPLGLPVGYGGPYVGLFACKDGRDYLQQIPGRLVGETVDKHGERGYVLTLSTREQHIRRERATSNICTNAGLCALAVTIRMCLLGKRGFVEVGRQCLSKAEYLKREIGKLAGYSLVYPSAATFNEFSVTVRGANAARAVEALEPLGFLAGLDLGRVDPGRKGQLLLAVTERITKADMDGLVRALDAL
jgi:glycine dehydrogenase subunit 1